MQFDLDNVLYTHNNAVILHLSSRRKTAWVRILTVERYRIFVVARILHAKYCKLDIKCEQFVIL